jgi:hypothetical protein
MTFHQRIPADFYSQPTKIRPTHYAEFIVDRMNTEEFRAYHLTLTYKQCQTPKSATSQLKSTLRLVLRKAIASRWDRERYRNTFEVHAFLDTAGSRNRQSLTMHVQDGYHHHCLLLVKRHIDRRIVTRLYTDKPARAIPIDLPYSPAKSIPIDLPYSPATSIHLERVDSDTVAHVASYAAKSVPYLSKAENDDYYLIFDHRGAT